MPVKFKISEMFDNSCELFENEMQHKNIESEKRIKEIVFLEIGHTKAKRNRRRYIAVLAAAMGIGGITVGAHEVLKSAGEIKNNEEVVLENQNGLALYEKENSGAIQMEVETDIILPENLYKDGIPIAKYIMELKTERNGSVPECYFDNGTMIVLIDFDGDTWNMKTGDTFILDFIQSDSDERGKARTLEIGYIFNGEVIDEKVISETENKIILDIPKSGQYGVYLKNVSSDRVTISQGILTVERGK